MSTKRCVLRISDNDLEAVLQLPEGAKIAGIERQFAPAGLVGLIVEGIGAEQRGDEPIVHAPYCASVQRHDSGKVSINWGLEGWKHES